MQQRQERERREGRGVGRRAAGRAVRQGGSGGRGSGRGVEKGAGSTPLGWARGGSAQREEMRRGGGKRRGEGLLRLGGCTLDGRARWACQEAAHPAGEKARCLWDGGRRGKHAV